MRTRSSLALALAQVLTFGSVAAADGGAVMPQLLVEDGDVSTFHVVGDLSFIYRADGSYAVFQRVGDVSMVTDSRPGMSGTAHHIGGTVIILRTGSTAQCNLIGDVMLCYEQALVAGR